MKRHPDPIVHFFISNLVVNKDLIPLLEEKRMLDHMTPDDRMKLHDKYERFCEVLTEAKIRNS